MGNLLFFLVVPAIFFVELNLINFGTPHLMLLIFCAVLVCQKQSRWRAPYAATFASMAALSHGASITPFVAGILIIMAIWYVFGKTFTRNWLTQTVVISAFMIGLLLVGGDFSWTAPFLIANIIIVPFVVSLWCGV